MFLKNQEEIEKFIHIKNFVHFVKWHDIKFFRGVKVITTMKNGKDVVKIKPGFKLFRYISAEGNSVDEAMKNTIYLVKQKIKNLEDIEKSKTDFYIYKLKIFLIEKRYILLPVFTKKRGKTLKETMKDFEF